MFPLDVWIQNLIPKASNRLLSLLNFTFVWFMNQSPFNMNFIFLKCPRFNVSIWVEWVILILILMFSYFSTVLY